MFPRINVLTVLALLGVAPPAHAPGRYIMPSRVHGYIPHPNAFRNRAKKRPYKGNLGPRHGK